MEMPVYENVNAIDKMRREIYFMQNQMRICLRALVFPSAVR